MKSDNFDYYVDNLDTLVNLYNQKYIIIHNREVVGAFDNILDAYVDAKKNYEPETFIIMHCVPGTESYSMTFHSRVRY